MTSFVLPGRIESVTKTLKVEKWKNILFSFIKQFVKTKRFKPPSFIILAEVQSPQLELGDETMDTEDKKYICCEELIVLSRSLHIENYFFEFKCIHLPVDSSYMIWN